MSKDSDKLTQYLVDYSFKKTPVTIDQFLDDPYYLGNYYTGIFPFWRKKLRELFPNNLVTASSYVVLTGAIGIGKSSISKIIIAYDIYKMSLLKNIPKFYQSMFKQGYHIKCYNTKLEKAAPMVAELNDLFFGGSVPYFRDQIKYGNPLLNHLTITPCSKKEHMVSDDVAGFILSEMNEIKPELADSIMKLAENRLWSRYRAGQNIMNHLIIDSSARNEGSVVDKFLENNPNTDDAFKVRVSHWESREGMGQYGRHGWFELYLGDSKSKPHMITSYEDRSILDEDLIIKVPNEYLHQVKNSNQEHLYEFIQDVCGRSTSSSYKFIMDIDKIRDSMKVPQKVNDIVTLDFYDKTDTLYDLLKDDIINLPTDRKLYFGLDCAASHDLYGFSIAYSSGVTRYNEENAGKLDYMNIVVPISIGISRNDGQETAINKVHDFILRLAEDHEIGCVSMDQYQSLDTKQILLQNGIKAEIRSIDRDDNSYITFKRWLLMGLIDLPTNEVLYNELNKLTRVKESNRYRVQMTRDGVSHGDIAASVVQVVSRMIELGPSEVLTEPRYSSTSMADLYESISNRHPRMIRSRNE